MVNLKFNWLIGITVISMLFLYSCDSVTDGTNDIGSSEEALVEVRIQNASVSNANKLQFAATENDDDNGNGQGRPIGNVEAVNIEVIRVEINNTENEETGWEVLTEPEEAMVVNLMELTNGEFEVLGVTNLEEGFYPQIRLILNSENNITVDGKQHPLKVPSGQQSGFKINVGLTVENGEDYTIMINFDADRSIVRTGPPNSPGYILKPTLNATVNGNDNSES